MCEKPRSRFWNIPYIGLYGLYMYCKARILSGMRLKIWDTQKQTVYLGKMRVNQRIWGYVIFRQAHLGMI